MLNAVLLEEYAIKTFNLIRECDTRPLPRFEITGVNEGREWRLGHYVDEGDAYYWRPLPAPVLMG